MLLISLRGDLSHISNIFRSTLVYPVRAKTCLPLKNSLTEVHRTTLMSKSREDLASGNKAQLKKV